jgi:SAM-dependent methyltransferase
MSRQGANRAPTRENVRSFWESEAREIGDTPLVTMRDHFFRIHELQTLLTLLPQSQRLLDIGCGTGFGTLLLARRARYTLGIDYSPQMIRWARKLLDDAEYRARLFEDFSPFCDPRGAGDDDPIVEFTEGDVLDLDAGLPEEPFDLITGQRILINLASHEHQMRALRQLRGHAAEGALLVLTEATHQGHARTDSYREQFGVPPLEKYWHNEYVNEECLSDWQASGWEMEQNLGFETYTLLSKVIYPAACGQENCQFLSGANAAAMELASVFRTRAAVTEIGEYEFLRMYLDRLRGYDHAAAQKVAAWLERYGARLPNWNGIGHQRLIIARPTVPAHQQRGVRRGAIEEPHLRVLHRGAERHEAPARSAEC